MKALLPFLMATSTVLTAIASTGFSAHKGVWSSDNAEAVLTDSICILY